MPSSWSAITYLLLALRTQLLPLCLVIFVRTRLHLMLAGQEFVQRTSGVSHVMQKNTRERNPDRVRNQTSLSGKLFRPLVQRNPLSWLIGKIGFCFQKDGMRSVLLLQLCENFAKCLGNTEAREITSPARVALRTGSRALLNAP